MSINSALIFGAGFWYPNGGNYKNYPKTNGADIE